MSVDIIDTMLRSKSESAAILWASAQNSERTHKGWRLTIPNFDASKPVRNGSTAEPACPTLAMYPRQPVRSQRGRMVVLWFIRIGYMGPMSSPMNDTANAFSMSDGTAQTVISSLRRAYQ